MGDQSFVDMTIAQLLAEFQDGQTPGAIIPKFVRNLIGSLAQDAASLNGAFYNVLNFGADPTAANDSTAAFVAAVTAANAAGNSNTVIVPSGTYKITDIINLNTGSPTPGSFAYPCRLQGIGWPTMLITPNASMATFATFIFWQGLNDYGNPLPALSGIKMLYTSASPAANGILCQGGNRPKISNVVIGNSAGSGPGGHGIMMATTFDNGWIEGAELYRCQVNHAGKYSFYWVNGNFQQVFITESGMHWCSSRFPGIGALALVQNNLNGSNFKIGDFKVYSCELDCSGGSSVNGVDIIQNSSIGGDIIESIRFQDTTIEDAFNASHSGHAVGFPGAGTASIGPIKLDNVTHYGFSQGAIDTSKISQGLYDIDTTPDGDIRKLSSLQIDGTVNMPGLPTSDPHVVGRLWRNSGVLTVSAG